MFKPYVYRAPEIILDNPVDLSYSADLWNLGVTVGGVSNANVVVFHRPISSLRS